MKTNSFELQFFIEGVEYTMTFTDPKKALTIVRLVKNAYKDSPVKAILPNGEMIRV